MNGLGNLTNDREAVFWQHGRICCDWEVCLKRKLSSSDAVARQSEFACVSRRRTMSTDINVSVDVMVNLDESRQLLMIDLAQHGMKVGKTSTQFDSLPTCHQTRH